VLYKCPAGHGPDFGVMPLLGTNPIAFAVPTDEPFPFLYDAATTIAARGKVEVRERAGKPTPAGWVVNEDGSMATDSAQILQDLKDKKAALLTLGGLGELMGGHKGYGLATSVEILCAAFQGGAFLSGLTDLDAQGKPQPLRLGHFLMAMDIEHFCPLQEFKKTTGDLLRELRASKRSQAQTGSIRREKRNTITRSECRRRGLRSRQGCSAISKPCSRSWALPGSTWAFDPRLCCASGWRLSAGRLLLLA